MNEEVSAPEGYKPFNWKDYKQGDEVVTRAGKLVVKDITYLKGLSQPVLVSFETENTVYSFCEDGRFYELSSHGESGYDLFVRKKTVWKNIYKSDSGFFFGVNNYKSKKDAEESEEPRSANYVKTIELELED